MAKGQKCPSCTKQTFQMDRAIYKCSSCGCVGWLSKPGSPGAGKGTQCGYCGENTIREIYSDKTVTVFACTACHAVFIPR